MEEAEARRQKLQALKERAKRAREGGDSVAEEAPKLKFRNYQPKTDEFKDGVVAPVKISADKELEKMGAVSFPHSLFPATLLLSIGHIAAGLFSDHTAVECRPLRSLASTYFSAGVSCWLHLQQVRLPW